MDNNKFSYTYSAPTEKERKEIESIKRRYSTPQDSDKSQRLKRLDAHVKNTASAVAITFGAVSSLIMGFGMSLVMSFGETLYGIIIGVIGLLGIIASPFAHSLTLRYQKQKHGQEILALAEELLGGENNNNESEEVE